MSGFIQELIKKGIYVELGPLYSQFRFFFKVTVASILQQSADVSG